MRILVIDNYDSFTYNLVQYLGELPTPAHEIEVVRNDHATVEDLLVRGYDRVIVSPGPVHAERGRHQPRGGQALPGGEDPDARRLPRPPGAGAGLGRHGHPPRAGPRQDLDDRARRPHDLRGLPQELEVGRYHSLVGRSRRCRTCSSVSATGGGVVMAVRHRELPAEGVQFHPESVLTEHGKEMLANFMEGTR